MRHRNSCLAAAPTIAAILLGAPIVSADTEFTYQGELTSNGDVADGQFDMTFTLWDALTDGSQIGASVSIIDVLVADGRFVVELDFGADALDNSARWLQIAVEGATLTPRQQVTRTPYALQTRGIIVDDDEHVGIGRRPGPEQVTIESLDGTALKVAGIGTALAAVSNEAGETVFAATLSQTGSAVYGLNFQAANWGYLGTAEHGVFGHAVGGSDWAGFFEGRGYFSDDTFIGRQESVTSQERFGVHSPAENGEYGGMYISTVGLEGWPFYGYAPGEFGQMWHYYDGATGIWHVNNGGNRLSVARTGNVAIGTTAFDARLNVRTVAGVGVRGATSQLSSFDFLAAGSGTDYGSLSSRRWKSDVMPIENPLDAIGRLRGVRYTWDAEHGGHRDVGMIAEEVGVVLPEIVSYEDNGVDAIAMDYSKLTPLLVEAVKALRTEHASELAHAKSEIESLRDENHELRQRLADLEALVQQSSAAQREPKKEQ